MSEREDPSLTSLVVSVYLPTLLFAVGQGAVVPVMALTASDLGASPALAGLAIAARGLGQMAFDVPAGALIERLGERRAMAVGTLVLVASLLAAIVSPSPWVFVAAVFTMGCGWSVWLLARLTYVSEAMPLHLRGRALSTLAGMNRIGNFIGPFLGAGVIVLVGLAGAYWLHIVMALAGWVALATATVEPRADHLVAHDPPPVRRIVREHRRVFLTAGLGVTALSVLRVSRHAIVPLWGAHIGLDPAQISVIFGISAAMDMTLFYPAGLVSDRFGRKKVAIPCLTMLATGFVLLPLSGTFLQLTVVGLVLGFGNGIGSGIVMTLGADFSPAVGRASFLGVWRVVGDIGQAGGPIVASAVTAAAGLGPAAVVVGAIGLAGALLVATTVPEPLHRHLARPQPPDPDASP